MIPVHTLPSSFFKIHFNSFILTTTSHLFPSGFPVITLKPFPFLPCMPHAPTLHPPWFYQLNFRPGVQIKKVLIIQTRNYCPFSCAVFNILECSVSPSHRRYTHLPYHPFLLPFFNLKSDSPALKLWILCWTLQREHINFSLVLCVQILFQTTKQRHDRTPASVSWGLVNCFVFF